VVCTHPGIHYNHGQYLLNINYSVPLYSAQRVIVWRIATIDQFFHQNYYQWFQMLMWLWIIFNILKFLIHLYRTIPPSPSPPYMSSNWGQFPEVWKREPHKVWWHWSSVVWSFRESSSNCLLCSLTPTDEEEWGTAPGNLGTDVASDNADKKRRIQWKMVRVSRRFGSRILPNPIASFVVLHFAKKEKRQWS